MRFSACVAAFIFCFWSGFAPASAQPNSNTLEIHANSALIVEEQWFSDTRCASPTGGMVTLRVGETRYRLPAAQLKSFMAAEAPTAEVQSGGLILHFARTIGCPDNPMHAAIVEIGPPASAAFPTLGIRERAPVTGLARKAQVLLELRDSSDGRCEPYGAGLVICRGGESTGGQRMPVAYILMTDHARVQRSGAPMHVRCLTFAPEQTICGISDDIDAHSEFEAVLASPATTQFTAETIVRAHQDMLAVLTNLKTPAP